MAVGSSETPRSGQFGEAAEQFGEAAGQFGDAAERRLNVARPFKAGLRSGNETPRRVSDA